MNLQNGHNGKVGELQMRPLMCRGVRGATTVERNTTEEILDATRELLLAVIHANGMEQDDVASVYLTLSPDLDATFPAIAARQLGLDRRRAALRTGNRRPRCAGEMRPRDDSLEHTQNRPRT
jgi:hypothetical protein